ncbi:MAG: hypothetical protein GC162_17925 [Planctomycetes bacterium]|nr:hypothetical protein [Planctomycetota bacterium]
MTDAHSTHTPPNAPARRKKRWPKILGGIVLLLILLVLLAPMLISTVGKGFVVSTVNGMIKGSVKIDGLNLSWLGGQSLSGVELLDPEGKPVIKLAKASTDLSLLSAVRGNLDLGKTVVDGLDASFYVDENGVSNLRRAVELIHPSPPSDEPAKVPPTLALQAQITNAKVSLATPHVEPVVVDNINASASLPSIRDAMTVNLTARSKQGELSGDLAVDAKLTDLFAADGLVTGDKSHIEAHVKANNLPVDGVDQIAGLGGKLTAALGSKLDASVAAEVTATSQNLAVNLTSPNAHVKLIGRVADGVFALTEPASVDMTLTPALVEKLAAGQSAMKLKAPAPLTLSIPTLRAPAGGFDPSKVELAVKFSADSDIALVGDETIGDVTIRNLAATVETKNLAEALAVALNADTTQKNQPGKIAVNADVSGLYNADKQLQLDKLKVNAKAQVQGVPTALIDQIAKQNGLIVEALGPIVNLDATATSTGSDTAQATLSIHTDNVQAENLSLIWAETIALRDAKVTAKISPALATRLMGGNPAMTLQKPLTAVVMIHELTAPRPEAGKPAFNPAATKLKAALTTDTIDVAGVPTAGEVLLDKLNLSIDGESLAALKVHLSALASQPTADLIAMLTGGAQLSVSAEASTGLDKDSKLKPIDATLALASAKLNAKLTAMAPGDLSRVALIEPAKANMVLTPALLKRLNISIPDAYAITGPTPVALSIDDLALPLKDLAVSKVALTMKMTLDAAGPKDPIAVLLGEHVALGAAIAPAINGTNVRASVEAAKVNTALVGVIDVQQVFTLSEPMSLSMTLSPDQLRQIGAVKEGQPTLGEPATITLKLSKLTAPTAGFALNKVQAGAEVAITKLVLTGNEKLDGTTLSDTQAGLAFDGPAGTASVALNGAASVKGQTTPGPLTVDAKVGKLFDAAGAMQVAAADVDASVTLKELPTSVVEAFAGKSGEWSPLIGDKVTLTAAAKVSGGPGGAKPTGTVDVNLASEDLAVDAGLKLADLLTLSRPATVKWIITPAAYAALRPAMKDQHTLVNPVTLAVAIDKLSYPNPMAAPPAPAAANGEATGSFDPSKVALSAAISASRMTFKETASGKTLSLDGLKITAAAPTLAQPTTLHVEAAVLDEANPQLTGRMLVDGTVGDVFDAAGKVVTDQLSAKLNAQIAAMPGEMIESLFGKGDGKLAALVGERADLVATTDLKHMQGPVTLKLDSTNVKVDTRGRITDGYLTLDQDAVATLMITEDFSHTFLNDPILKEAVKSETPAKLVIGHQDFRFPIRDYSIEKINMPVAMLDPGKLIMRNAGVIETITTLPATVGKLAKRDFGSVISQLQKDEVPAWFTPMDFSLVNGVLTLGRMDMLIGEDYQLATWGKLDMARNHGRMVLGIAERAMRKIYGITVFSDNPDYVDQFIMEGPIDQLGPDKKELSARILLLTSGGIASQVGGETVGGIVGQVIQGVGAAAQTFSKKEVEPAPPAKKPFPWPAEKVTPATQQTQQQQQPATQTQPKPATQQPAAQPKKSASEELLEQGLQELFKKKKK